MRKIIITLLLGWACVSVNAQTLSVEEVFRLASEIEGFQNLGYIEDDIEFPECLGTPEMIIHGNAEPRDHVLLLLSHLPEGSLVYDDTDERGKFDRIFIDKKTYNLLYVHLGFGPNDSVLTLFHGGDKDCIENFIRQLNRELW